MGGREVRTRRAPASQLESVGVWGSVRAARCRVHRRGTSGVSPCRGIACDHAAPLWGLQSVSRLRSPRLRGFYPAFVFDEARNRAMRR